MNDFRKKQWPALIAWIVVVLIAIVAMPNVSALVRENGGIQLPSTVESEVANKIQKKANNNKSVRTYTAVFSNHNSKLSSSQSSDIESTLDDLEDQSGLDVTNIMGPSDNAETRKQLISKDKTTQLAQITVKENGTVKHQVNALNKQLKVSGIKTYITGVDPLNDDFSTVTEKGIQKTEVIAIIFIFIVLILVFRSPIVPIISLLNVGVAFITSLSIVMNLAQHVGFPISNFTQVFLVVVLFGIGTDYNILLYDYFKGALADGLDPVEAMRSTRKHGGRTVLYSGLSVLIGFSVLWLAKFSFYQSASAVAIGVLVLLPVLLTLNMFFMATLGPKLFWPSKISSGSSSSRLWHGLSKAALAQPAIVLVVIAALAIPFALTMNGDLNFNNADELPSSYQSKAGYEVIQDHFSKGMTAPITVYIKNDSKLNTQSKLAAIDQLTQYVQKEDGVKTVASVTEPGGNKISSMYLGDQLKTITKGLDTSKKGLNKIKSGLDDANTQLSNANISGSMSQVQELADGTQELASGTQQLQSGINSYTAGVSSANSGAQQLASGSSQAASGANTLSSSSQTLSSGASQVASGSNQLASSVSSASASLPTLSSQVQQLNSGSQTLATQMNQLTTAVNQLRPLLAQMQGSNAISQMTNGQLSTSQIATLVSSINQLNSGTSTLNGGISQFTSALPGMTSQISQLSSATQTLASGANQVASGSSQLASGAGTLASANSQLASGASTLASGTSTLDSSSSTLNSGASTVSSASQQVNTGVQTLNTKLQAMSSQVDQLQSGLGDASDGLASLSEGNDTMNQYLTELRKSYIGKDFYLPKSTIKSKTFKPALDTYMADNNKITTMTVVLKGDPNSTKANTQFKRLQKDIKAQVKHGALGDAQIAIGGQTSQDNDLRTLANGDFQRTAIIMLIGIGIALIVVIQSLLQPMMIIGTLLAAYAISMSLTRIISATFLGRPLLSWNTPFFTFIMLMALGVDYSIFLMIRYKDDHDDAELKNQMLRAATAIGAVVISAAIILSGTFAALIPSGVTTLIQVALGVIIGLVALVFLLPLTLSSVISLTEFHEMREHGLKTSKNKDKKE
ncbi:MMPL family transporter [Companilactobacillus alimentarius]|uniref:MMPL family transporter n=1 Tax=Companilactobacillus alimentarius TaxID=1602 RepID=UPI0028B94236|nr:MMPL family transporter [Companilactobacillus alimentarius]MDT6952642.1 MMPL family transporter [Companilactobacillus alimentarius]